MIKNRAILIVDDSKINRVVLQKIFSVSYNTLEAENGAQALELLRERTDMIGLVILDLKMPVLDGFGVLNEMSADKSLNHIPVVVITASNERETQIQALDCGALDVLTKPFDAQIILHRVRNILARQEAAYLAERNAFVEEQLRLSRIDARTGVFNKETFCEVTKRIIAENPGKRYVIAYFNIDRFNIFNDAYGTNAGDRLLSLIGSFYIDNSDKFVSYGHFESDHFVSCSLADGFDPHTLLDKASELLSTEYANYEFVARMGIYTVDGSTDDVAIMCYYAYLALESISDNFLIRTAYYDESMREALLEEQEIVNEMNQALESNQFAVWFQPQYDYATGHMIGAEALVRWIHPVKGIVSPGRFIPVFEKNGFIAKLDEYVWKQSCKIQSAMKRSGMNIVPVSVNVSRCDIYNPHLCELITSIVKENGLEINDINLEITESAYMENPEQLISIVDKLRKEGFCVEMDDFGSSYSSLNTLKTVPVDLLKLDMKFLDNDGENSKSGSILSSIVRMAHQISLPVLAEGVETKEQADYLKSIGCVFMQGYLFAKPMPEDKYRETLKNHTASREAVKPVDNGIKEAANFFDASMQSTLLFNSFVGGAYILEYTNDNRLEILRVNDRFYTALGTNYSEYEYYTTHVSELFDEKNFSIYLEMLHSALRTGDEAECEILANRLKPDGKPIWTHCRARCLANRQNDCIFYVSVENITERKELESHNAELSRQLTAIMGNLPGAIINYRITEQSIEQIFVNDNAAAMFGYDNEEFSRLFAKDPLSSVYPDDVAEIRRLANDFIGGKKSIMRTKFRHKCRDGRWRWTEIYGRGIPAGDGELVASVIMLDIDKQVHSEQNNHRQAVELDKQRLELELMYKTVPCGIIQFSYKNHHRRLISFNETAWKILGFRSEQQYLSYISETGVFANIHEDDAEFVEAGIVNAIKRNAQADLNHRVIMPDGSTRWIHLIAHGIKSLDNDEVVQAIFSDITVQKQDIIKQYCKILFSAYDEVYEIDTEQNTSVLLSAKSGDANANIGVYFPLYDRIENFCDMVLPEEREQVKQFFTIPSDDKLEEIRCIAVHFRHNCNENGHYELTMFHADGSVYFICNREAMGYYAKVTTATPTVEKSSAVAQPIGFSDKTVMFDGRYTAIFKERVELLTELTDIAAAEWNLGEKRFFSTSNYRKYEISKYDPFYILSQGTVNFVHPDDAAELVGTIKRLTSKVTSIAECSVRMKMCSGGFRWTKICASYIENDSHMLITFTDINELRELEIAMRGIREKKNGISENLYVGIAVLDFDIEANRAVPHYFSTRACEMFGYDRREYDLKIANNEPTGYWPDKESLPEGYIETLTSGKLLVLEKFRVTRCDGSRFWIRAYVRLIRDSQNHNVLYIAFSDTTEQVERDADMTALLNSFSGGIFKYSDENREISYISANMLEMLGCNEESFREKHGSFMSIIYPDDRKRIIDEIDAQTEKGNFYSCEYRVNCLNGKPKWVLNVGNLITDANGSKGYYNVVFDIDRRKELESKLETEVNIKNALIKNTPGGVATLSYKNGRITSVYVSDGVCRLFGYSGEELEKQYMSDFAHGVHPDDRERIQRAVLVSVTRHFPFREQFRRLRSSGDYIWISLVATDVRSAEGEGVFYGSYSDISELKKLEAELKIEKEKINIALQNSNITIWDYSVINDHLTCQSRSSAGKYSESFFEKTPDEAVKGNFICSQSADDFILLHKRVARGEKSPASAILVNIGGEHRWLQMTYHTIFRDDGAAVGAVGVSFDITPQINAKKRYNDEMQYLSAVQSDELIDKGRANITRNILEDYFDNQSVHLVTSGETLSRTVELLVDTAATTEQKQNLTEKLSPEYITAAFASGKKVYTIEYQRYIPKKKRSIWVEMTLKLYSDPESNDIKAFIYTYDADRQKTSRLILDTIVDRGYEYIGLMNTSNMNIHTYRTTEFELREYGRADRSYDDVFEKIINSRIVEEERTEAQTALGNEYVAEVLKSKKSYSCSFTLDINGTKYRKKWEFSYLDESKKTIVILRSDVSEIFKRQEEQRNQLRQALIQAANASSAKSIFLANVSHDMRTPLNGVICCTELALESRDNDEVRSYLYKIRNSGKILLNLINDTLDLSKIETKKIVLNRDTVRASELVSTILASVHLAADEKKISISTNVVKSSFSMLRVDVMRIQKIFGNILSNSIKYTPEGGHIDVIVECIKLEPACAHEKIIIRDNGIGISGDFLPHVFEPFSQENSSDYNGPAGTGLGLSISKQLIELLGGRIEITSEKGKGTEVTVFLDCERIPDKKAESDYKTPKPVTLDGRRCLVCEDNTINTEITKAILKKYGVTADCARNGQEGLDMFIASPEGTYDFILMDIRMPVMDGHEASRAIRGLDRSDSASVPIIAMSANAFDEDIKQSYASGMNEHIAKPINLETFYETIVKSLRENE